ncbi:hypothetical protein ERX37_04810 [Macrococcus hajekii]|uniref:Uncharacterized protein n=1 Tax=Macrococcus hajekii TaxID=198482 RepID=A0A4R6BNQ1_9STAP|nr:hypothetical protein [Macrococcus hajekii]TDM03408.1 hypothetical protein ERX37_04810 [Macrococcus hajekii]GGA98630.1 hypothetical protein GCM10007190_03280 [Macrococcus hajekii]
METYDPFSSPVSVNEDRTYSKKQFIKRFYNVFTKIELLSIVPIVIFSIILSHFVTSLTDDCYKLIKDIAGNLVSYFSITIGFSLATIVFIIDNLKNYNADQRKTLLEILTLITAYIIHGLAMICFFLLHHLIGDIIKLNDSYYIVNLILISFLIIMILLNLTLFYKIIKVVYYFSYITIKKL